MGANTRMSDVEALMWNLEKDPSLASSFANVTILDRRPDVDRLRYRLAKAMDVVPRLRHRVAPGLGRLAPPEWQEDQPGDWFVVSYSSPTDPDRCAPGWKGGQGCATLPEAVAQAENILRDCNLEWET